MTRTRTNWKVRDHVFTIGERTLIMGVLNVTPDSFSDGGKYLDPDAAVERALELEQQGADILDIGAESTKPGAERISAGEELRRLIPVLKRLKDKIGIPISVDTYKAEVAEKALEHGASIINDISALTWEPDILKPVLQYDAGLILNHMRGTPETWSRLGPMKDVMGTLVAELEAAIHRATTGSIARDRIVIDPGIGFGKRGDQNSEILARLRDLERLGFPILVAVSRKSFLGQENPEALEFATAAAVTTAILHGASIVRVHDVAAMKPVVNTVDAVIEATPEAEERGKPYVKPRMHAEVEAERRARPVRPRIVAAVASESKPADIPLVAAETEEPASAPLEQEAKPEADAPTQEEARPRRPFERRSEAPSEERPIRKPYQQQDRPPQEQRDRPFWQRPPRDEGRPARPSGPRDSKPYERNDRPFRPRPDQGDERPARPPYQRSGPPQRQSGPNESRPYERSDRPFRPRPDQGGERTARPPYQRSGPPQRQSGPNDARPYERSDRPFRPRPDQGGERTARPPYQRSGPPQRQSGPNDSRPPFRPRPDGGGDRPDRRPYRQADNRGDSRPDNRSDRGPDRGDRKPFERRDRPFPPRDDRGGPSKFGGRSGPGNDSRSDRPRPGGGFGGPKRGGGSGPPKRPGSGPPRKRY